MGLFLSLRARCATYIYIPIHIHVYRAQYGVYSPSQAHQPPQPFLRFLLSSSLARIFLTDERRSFATTTTTTTSVYEEKIIFLSNILRFQAEHSLSSMRSLSLFFPLHATKARAFSRSFLFISFGGTGTAAAGSFFSRLSLINFVLLSRVDCFSSAFFVVISVREFFFFTMFVEFISIVFRINFSMI